MSTFVKDTEMMEKELDFNVLGAQALEEIKNGKPMFGKDGAFATAKIHQILKSTKSVFCPARLYRYN